MADKKMADRPIIINPDYKTSDYRKYPTHVEPRLAEIYQWVLEGKTDYSIADSLGISRATLLQYKKDNIGLIDAYARARKERNVTVMNKMLQKASGHIATVQQEKLTKSGDIVSLKSEIYTPPDPNAADLFLRNNDPEYKSARAAELSGGVTVNILSVTEQRRLIAEVLQQDLKGSEPAIDAAYTLITGDNKDGDI